MPKEKGIYIRGSLTALPGLLPKEDFIRILYLTLVLGTKLLKFIRIIHRHMHVRISTSDLSHSFDNPLTRHSILDPSTYTRETGLI